MKTKTFCLVTQAIMLFIGLFAITNASSLDFLSDEFEMSPGCGICTCDSQNNQREILPDSKPTNPDHYEPSEINKFSLYINLLWYANKNNNLDIHLKSLNGVEIPTKVDHFSEFENTVRREVSTGGGSYKNEEMNIYPEIPKGEYLLYVFNCSNEYPLIFSEAEILIKTKTHDILKFEITKNMFYVNERIWRIAYIESDGNGKVIIKGINKVSKSSEVVFDGN